MGKFSRDKGKTGERELAALCREQGYDVHRTAQFRGNTGAAGDCEGLPGIHIECKRTERFSLYDALTQAQRDATAEGKGNMPVVFHRRNNSRWVAVMSAEDWFALYRRSEYEEKKNSD
jgi:Holliday junction resolvase